MGGHFFFDKTFSANTSKNTPKSLKMELTPGVVHAVVIDFPAGCLYLTHVRILRAATSIFPRNQGAFYAYENYQLEIDDHWILADGETELTLEGYNTDDSKDHTIRVALQVTNTELFYAQLGLLEKMDHFIKQQKAILGE